jgi:Ca2+/Na+ antiporter
MPSSDSMFGMDDESCFLCGGTVFAYESTATSAMMGSCFVADVVGWSRSRVRMRTTVTHDRLMQRRGKLMGCLLSLASATFCLHRHIGVYKLRLQRLVLSVTC